MLYNTDDGVLANEGGLPENLPAISSCLEGTPAIGFEIPGGLLWTTGLTSFLSLTTSHSLSVSAIKLAQLE